MDFSKLNMNDLMKTAQEMQQKMQSAKQDQEKVEYSGKCPTGSISSAVFGNHKLKNVRVSDEMIKDIEDRIKNPSGDEDSADAIIKELCDLIIASVNNACDQADQGQQKAISDITGGIDIPSGLV